MRPPRPVPIVSMLRTIALVSTAISVVSLEAMAFSYDEAISGDIDSPLETPPVFAFELGDNPISGSRFDGDDHDIDIFGFVVPDGSQLASIRLDYEVTRSTGDWTFLLTLFQIWTHPELGGWRGGGTRLGAAAATIISDGSEPVIPDAVSPVELEPRITIDIPLPPTGELLLPLSSGRYVLNEGAAGLGTRPFHADWRYTLTFSLVPIPEPGSALLLGLGLAGLSVRRRRELHSQFDSPPRL